MLTTERGGPPSPRLPTGARALMHVLREGGTHAQGAVAAAVAQVFDTHLHEGIYVKQFLTVEDVGP